MDKTAPTPAPIPSTGSTTMATLIDLAAERYGDAPALRAKRDGAWQETSYRELGQIVTEVGRGLIDLGIAAGDRVCILANTRPEWTTSQFGIASAGAVVVPIYQTNAPEECEWVLGDAEAVAVICEDAAQVAKIEAVRARLPHLRTVIVIDPDGETGDAIPLDEVRGRGRRRELAELRERTAAVTPDALFTIIYTSGTTGPPKGCVLTHGNYRNVLNMVLDEGEGQAILGSGDTVYLYLPLAHSFALLIALVALDVGVTVAYWGGDTKQIVAELAEVKPTFLPSVPRIFEKIYTLATDAVAQSSPEDQERFHKAIALGMRVRDLEARGEPIPAELAEPFAEAEERLFKNVRAIFGGQLREAVTGAAPIAPEILEFFWACGVPVLEGYGMTETSTVATHQTIAQHKFGTVGRPLPGCEVRIADDGEILIRGGNVFQGYYKNDDASFGAVSDDGWLHTGDLGSLDEDGFLTVTGRKKDIIITAGGKNLTPANIENDLKTSRWISQAVMHGDRRPYPVALITLDEEEILPWARERGKPEDVAALAADPDVHALVQGVLDEVNGRYAQVEQVKKFFIPAHDLTQETGELTPTLKVKRNVVNEKFAAQFDRLYT